MSTLKTDYKQDILAPSMDGKRKFNLVDSEGNVVYANVHIEDVSSYSQVGDEFDAEVINGQNEAINKNASDISEINTHLSDKVGKAWTYNSASDALSYALDGTPKLLNCSIVYTINNIQHVSTITISVRGTETGSSRFVAGGASVYVQLDINWNAKTYTNIEKYNGQTVPTNAVIWDWR